MKPLPTTRVNNKNLTQRQILSIFSIAAPRHPGEKTSTSSIPGPHNALLAFKDTLH